MMRTQERAAQIQAPGSRINSFRPNSLLASSVQRRNAILPPRNATAQRATHILRRTFLVSMLIGALAFSMSMTGQTPTIFYAGTPESYVPVDGSELDIYSCLSSPLSPLIFGLGNRNGTLTNAPFLYSEILLTDGHGNWTPASGTFSGNPSTAGYLKNQLLEPAIFAYWYGGQYSTYQWSLSSTGVLTVREYGSMYINIGETGGGVSGWNSLEAMETWSGNSTVNLNTGEDTWQLQASLNGQGVYNVYQDGNGGPVPCGINAQLSGSSSAIVPVTLVPYYNSTSPTSSLQLVNPAGANVGHVLPFPPNVTNAMVSSAPTASAISADGASAAVIVYQSNSPDSITLNLFSTAFGSSTAIGTVTAFQSNYLVNPSPGQSIVGAPLGPTDSSCGTGPGGDGTTCTFLALLWPPPGMPNPPASSDTLSPTTGSLVVTATRDSASQTASITLQPPPVVLVHGVWSNAQAAWVDGGFMPWLQANYPNGNLIYAADYGPETALTFEDSGTQMILATTISNAINFAAEQHTVSTKVDVVSHSLGGLVTEYFMDNPNAPYGASVVRHK